MESDICTVRALAEQQGGVVTREQARECGCGETGVRRLLRSGEWVSLRRGVLVPADLLVDPHRRLLADAAAVWLALGRRPVLSQGTAAVVHGLLIPQPPRRAELTADPRVLRWRQGDGFRLSAATLPSHHRAVVAGLPVTTVARTVVDLARSLPRRHAVVLTDDALHRSLTSRAELDRLLIDCAVWPRIRRAALVVAASDERAESPLETVCRLVFARHGLPRRTCRPYSSMNATAGGRGSTSCGRGVVRSWRPTGWSSTRAATTWCGEAAAGADRGTRLCRAAGHVGAGHG